MPWVSNTEGAGGVGGWNGGGEGQERGTEGKRETRKRMGWVGEWAGKGKMEDPLFVCSLMSGYDSTFSQRGLFYDSVRGDFSIFISIVFYYSYTVI